MHAIMLQDLYYLQGGFQIVISVENRDGDSQIEQFRIIPTITRNHTFTEPQTINGEFGSAMIVLSFRLTCTDNFYGDNCEVFCLGRDDDSGHYFCNPITGAIECLPGFRDPSRGCTVHMGESVCICVLMLLQWILIRLHV